MKVNYDKYYQTENLFGEAYPDLVNFFATMEERGKLLDLGCGQGRDAIALAKLGFEVTGIDHSTVGIAQLNKVAMAENLPLRGLVGDIYEYADFGTFDFILLDSMFHFSKKDQEKETKLIARIFASAKPNALITFCLQHTEHKLNTLNAIIGKHSFLELVHQTGFTYTFVDQESNHQSVTKYKMIVVQKR